MNEKTNKYPAQSRLKILLVTAILLMASSLTVNAQDESVPPFPTTRIRGTIRTCAGVPLPGVIVNIDGDFGSAEAVTNASGVFTATLELGLYTVTPVPPQGYFFSPQYRVTGTTNNADFTRYPRDNRANFDGDCRTDVSVFNRGSGEWRVLNSSNGQIVSFFFGLSADIPTPGDYNADGKTDYAVFRPSDATWYIANDTSGSFYGVPFGLTGDIPVARDYDGDAKTDIAVFRPGNATWYILRSSDNGVTITQFGETGDRVVPGDYDGDDKADVAVFHPGPTGVWRILNSTTNTETTVQFGVTSDWPVQADYNGDGRTDIAVFRPSDTIWYIRRPDGTFYGAQWGLVGDRTVPGDYDGDGLADVAIQRPNSGGTWWILFSSGGHTAINFDNEFPVPAKYLTPIFW